MRIGRPLYAILDDNHNVVPVTIDEFVQWFSEHDRTVALDELPNGMLVSTVFLGMNHDYTGTYPLWFETMVFKDHRSLLEEDMDRYETWDEALEGHARMVARYTTH